MSAKARVEATLAATRQSFAKTPILEANDPTPQVKTAVGITYSALSQAMLAVIDSAKTTGQPASHLVESLKDALYLSPRLSQWNEHEVSLGYNQWRIYANDDATFVVVEKGSIVLHKGIRETVVSKDPLVAGTLFIAIETAQGIVQPYEAHPMTEEEQEEFFAADDMNGADIDSALADPPTRESIVEDPEIDDGGLIGEVHDQVAPSFVEEEVTRYSERANSKNAKIDGVICGYCGNMNKQQYRGLCPQCPVGTSVFSKDQLEKAVVAAAPALPRLKSLQGRILNIVEAAIADKTQREAVKTLVNKEFRREMNKITDEE